MLFSYVPFGVTVMVLGCPDYLQGTNIRLPEIKYFACPKILTDILSFEAHFGNSETINFTIDFRNPWMDAKNKSLGGP
jgi:hypothetical protein